MKETKPHLSSFVPWLTLVAAVFFAQGPAFAQVKGYVVINPIAVCTSSGTCPTFGMSCGFNGTSTFSCKQYNSPSAANQTTQSQLSTPIGFVDADNNRNLTRATWIRSGLDVVFLPIQQWNTDNNSNMNPWCTSTSSCLKDASTNSTFSSYTTTYQTIHTVNVFCNDFVPGTTTHVSVLTSPDLQALTQRKVCDDHGGALDPIVLAANPPAAPTGGGKAVPLAINGCSTALPCSTDPTTHIGNSNAVDMLFLTTISVNPGASGAVNGLSWINHNGIAIAKSGIAVAAPPFGVIPHELGHGLALTHTDYGASGIENLLTSGNTRKEPSTSGCSAPGAGNTNGGVLFDLAYAPAVPTTCMPSTSVVADGLKVCDPATDSSCTNQYTPDINSGTPCPLPLDPTTCKTQQGAVLPSGFVNLSLSANATAGGGSSATAMTTAQTSSSSSNGGIPFQVDTFNEDGEPNATVSPVIFALTHGLDFQGSSPATQTGGTGCNPYPTGCTVFITSQSTSSGNTGLGNNNCNKSVGLAPPARHCVEIAISGLTQDKFITFTLKIADAATNQPLTDINKLAGTQFTVFSDNGKGTGSQYATTTTFQTVGGVLQPANTQFPDLSVNNRIVPTTFVGATQTPCAPPTGVYDPSQCKAGELPQGPD